MEFHLRFGMHRDIQLMHRAQHLFDGFIIPAHILAHQTASTSVFVTSLPSKPYVVDPMTFVLQNPRGNHFTEAGELRPSVRKLCDDYDDTLSKQLEELHGNTSLEPDFCEDVAEFTKHVAAFQINKIKAAASESAAAKYLERYKQTKYVLPRLVLAPYFFFDSVGDDWYALSLNCARQALKLTLPRPVAPVIAANLAAFTDKGISQIVKDYEKFGHVFIWIHDFKETMIGAEEIVRFRKFISAISSNDRRVEMLYGGYTSLLASFDGVSGFGHGILYTTHKSMYLTPGGGGAPERYYIPAFHDFRSLSQSAVLVAKKPRLLCRCDICEPTLGGDPMKFSRLALNPELLRLHFLTTRKREREDLQKKSKLALLNELDHDYENYNKFVSLLPNPDAPISGGTMAGLEYMRQWSQGFREKLER